MIAQIIYQDKSIDNVDIYDVERQVENGVPVVSFSASYNQSIYDSKVKLIEFFFVDGGIYKVDNVSGSYNNLKVTGKDYAGWTLSNSTYQRNNFSNGVDLLEASEFKSVYGKEGIFLEKDKQYMDALLAQFPYAVVSNQGSYEAVVNTQKFENAVIINSDQVEYKSLTKYITVKDNQEAWNNVTYDGMIYHKKRGQLYATIDGSQPDTSYLSSEIKYLDNNLSGTSGLPIYWYIEQLRAYDQIFTDIKLDIIDRDPKKSTSLRSPVSFMFNGTNYVSNNYKYDQTNRIELL